MGLVNVPTLDFRVVEEMSEPDKDNEVIFTHFVVASFNGLEIARVLVADESYGVDDAATIGSVLAPLFAQAGWETTW